MDSDGRPDSLVASSQLESEHPMQGASKILTVSYGTFSCTLEGFDDPFNTMKAIAEYFRDLAAGDRYFGAEPPQPDAAMLHRIAEREIQRRVEAKIDQNGVVLRAGDLAPAAEAPAPPLRPPVSQPVPPAVSVQTVSMQTAMPAPSLTEAAPAESVAARLKRLREEAAALAATDAYIEDEHAQSGGDFLAAPPAPAARNTATPETAQPRHVPATEPAPRPEKAPVAAEDLAPAKVAAPAVAETVKAAAPVAEWDGDSGEPFDEDYSDEDDTLVEAAFDVPESLEAESLEARPLMPEAETAEAIETEAVEDLAEVLPAETVATETVAAKTAPVPDYENEDFDLDALTQSLGEPSPLAAETAAVEEAAAADAEAEEGAVDYAALADILPEAAPAGDGTDDVADALPELTEEAPDDQDALAALLGTQAEAEVKAEAAPQIEAEESAIDPAADVSEDILPAAAAATAATADDGEPAAPVNLSEKAQRARARVIRIRRAPSLMPAEATAPEVVASQEPAAIDTPAAPAAEDAIAALMSAPEEEPATPEPAQIEEAALSPEAEADLQRELAALQGGDDLSETGVVAAEEPLDPLATDARGRLEPKADAAVDRLIAQTNTALEGPENKRRLSAIAHLKAAVAATLADRLSRGQAGAAEPSREEPYRDDLERAVRPRRPVAGEGAATARPGLGRPSADRPAPLVLVSEQRIDRPRHAAEGKPAKVMSVVPSAPAATPAAAPGPVVPVRPRRVSHAPAAAGAAQQRADLSQSDLSQVEDDDADMAEDDAGNAFEDSRGFAEFAEKLGASDLASLLEAAAAYASCVEGRPHFSRPQLLRQVNAVSEGEISREDQLRSFGRLLRDGRIAKLRRGQFVLTEQSHLLAEAKKIAG